MSLRRAILLLAAAPLAAVLAFVAWPLPEELLSREGVSSLSITDRHGGTLRELRSREDGRSVPLTEVPPLVQAAFVAAEDRRFGLHPGVDPVAVLRAALQNLRAGRIVSGASTITMQLARRLVPRERSFVGKAGEALWALRLSAWLPEERILLEYVNRVPLGNSVQGVEAAAQLYFGRPAARLSAGQAALLAAIARSPARLDPYRRPEAARSRMLVVLAAMEGMSPESKRIAAETPLDLVPPERAFGAPHLTSWIAGSLASLGLDEALRIETTLDPALQRDVERILREELAGLSEQRVGQAAAIVIDNESGEVLAYVGSVDFFDDGSGGQNDGVRSLRQPGSALKPFAYGLALEGGATPATVLSDVETHLSTPSGDYVPRNYDRRVHGPVRLRAALASSYNVPAVRLAETIGPERLLSLLRRAGFESLKDDAAHYGVGLVLGNGDVSLRELARAYRGLARGGVAGPLREIRRAFDAEGGLVPLPPELEERRFLSAEATALLTDILSDEGARSPAFGLDNALRLPFPVAAKTGTSRAYVDNWTAGYTAERTVAIWVGNFDGTPMRGVSGITGAGPLFRRVMIRAMEGIRPAPLVDRSRFAHASICPLSGGLAGQACPGAIREVFLPGTEPRQPCAMHRLVEGRPVLDVGPGFYAWAKGEGLPSAPAPGAAGEGRARLVLPGDGDEYLLDPALPLEDQTVPLQAIAPAGATRLEVRIDGRPLLLEAPFTTRLPLGRGEHEIDLLVPGDPAPADRARFRVR